MGCTRWCANMVSERDISLAKRRFYWFCVQIQQKENFFSVSANKNLGRALSKEAVGLGSIRYHHHDDSIKMYKRPQWLYTENASSWQNRRPFAQWNSEEPKKQASHASGGASKQRRGELVDGINYQRWYNQSIMNQCVNSKQFHFIVLRAPVIFMNNH